MLSAQEIQCKSSLSSVDVVFKRSPQTMNYYLLFFEGEQVFPFVLLEENLILAENKISYSDQRLNFSIDEHLKNGELQIGDEKLELTLCERLEKEKGR